MKQSNSRKGIHGLFDAAIFVKGVDGALEIVGGIVLLFVPLHRLDTVLRWLLAHELSTERHDWLAKATAHLLDILSVNSKLFASVYLVGHGAVKIFLVYALWREKLWTFP